MIFPKMDIMVDEVSPDEILIPIIFGVIIIAAVVGLVMLALRIRRRK